MHSPENPVDQLIPASIEAFWGTIPPVWNRIQGNLRSIAEENYDISVEQFHILRHIRRGLTSVSQLAEVKQISRSAVSQAVDVLVERGLICRLQDSRDRRNIPLNLTESGSRLLDAISEKNRLWMKQQLSALSERELEALSFGLEILGRTFAPLNLPTSS